METTESLDQLAPSPTNPRAITDEALAGLGASLTQFGDLSGVVLNTRSGHLVAGHQRVRALTEAGAVSWKRDGDVGYIEHPHTGERFPVRVVDWDEQTELAANLTANNPEIAGTFTEAALEQLIGLQDEMPAGDFEDLRLDAMLEQLREDAGEADPSTGNVDPDDAPEPPADPITQVGDLIIMGQHRLLCGDSTSKDDVSRLMDGRSAALMATDPPYGDSWVQKAKDMERRGYGHSHAGLHGHIANDELHGDRLREFADKFLAVALTVGPPPLPFYVWCGGKRRVFEDALLAAGLHIHQTVHWLKPGFVIGRMHYHPRTESALHGWMAGSGACPFYGERNQSDVWEVGRENDKIHPTQKPVLLFETPLLNHTRQGEICYEPFAGSGSQVIAAERLGRRCFAMELAPAYCDVVVERWEKFTGGKAERPTR